MLEEPSGTASAIRRLKEEIEKLILLQGEALKMAIYLGMTVDDEREYDDRRAQILSCVQDLKMLEEAE